MRLRTRPPLLSYLLTLLEQRSLAQLLRVVLVVVVLLKVRLFSAYTLGAYENPFFLSCPLKSNVFQCS